MKGAILAAVIAAAVGGFVSSSDAQDVKKLPPHPAAAADPSLRQAEQQLPKASGGAYVGGASADYRKPATGEAVVSGATSTSESKQSQ